MPARPVHPGRPVLARRGFTLVELLVAGIISAAVAGATAMSIGSLTRARTRAGAREQAWSRAELAAARVEADLRSAARDSDLRFAHVSAVDGRAGEDDRDELLLFTRSIRPVRGDDESPEGGLFEVQYRVMADPETGRPALWRRIDPAHDLAIDGGGLAGILARGVVGLNVEAMDAENWYDSWDSDTDGLPHAVRVTITATDDQGLLAAVLRRTVAIDRVPIPPAPEEESTETGDQPSQPQSQPPTQTPAPVGGATGGGAPGGGLGGGIRGGGPGNGGGPRTGGGGGGARGGGGGGGPQ
jgi:type II secretion system protein J